MLGHISGMDGLIDMEQKVWEMGSQIDMEWKGYEYLTLTFDLHS